MAHEFFPYTCHMAATKFFGSLSKEWAACFWKIESLHNTIDEKYSNLSHVNSASFICSAASYYWENRDRAKAALSPSLNKKVSPARSQRALRNVSPINKRFFGACHMLKAANKLIWSERICEATFVLLTDKLYPNSI